MSAGDDFRARLARMQLRPTHRCFDDALDLLEDRVRERDLRCLLVHGICLIPGTDTRFAHAWVEEPDGCIVQAFLLRERRAYIRFTASDFNQIYRPQECTRYSVHAAWRMNELYKTYGPWEERYLALCREQQLRTWDITGKLVSE